MDNRQRIMVIDRDRDSHQLLDSVLATEGFDTIVVTDSDNALAQLRQVEPDLIILDATGGDEDYRELQRIRRNSDVPVIILASRYESEDLRKAFSLGADDYVRKPCGTRLLVARIRAKLRRCSAGAALVG